MNHTLRVEFDESFYHLLSDIEDLFIRKYFFLTHCVVLEVSVWAIVHANRDGLVTLVVGPFVDPDQVGVVEFGHNVDLTLHFLLPEQVNTIDLLDSVAYSVLGCPDHSSEATLSYLFFKGVLFHLLQV